MLKKLQGIFGGLARFCARLCAINDAQALAGYLKNFWPKRRTSASASVVAFVLMHMIGSDAFAADITPADLISKDYWRAIAKNEYRIPENADAMAHMRMLIAFTASTDPTLRDDIGYETFWRWVHRSGRFRATDFDALRTALLPMALTGLGEPASDRIFGRSFALLFLKELAAADMKTPFLTDATFAELLALGVDSLAKEKDSRGYVADKGWAHATGHTADLLKTLARNPRLSPLQAAAIVDAIVARTRSAVEPFAWGEDERLAAGLAVLASRADAEVAPFERWTTALKQENKVLWRGAFDVARYRQIRNQAALLAHMAAIMGTRPASVTPTAGSTRVSQLISETIRALQ